MLNGFLRFYSSVILNSTETKEPEDNAGGGFYSSVILNSTETARPANTEATPFYSSVILNSTETDGRKKRI